MFPSKTWLEISQSALQANARGLKRFIGKKTDLIAVVKSNAYGHGTTSVVRSLSTIADRFAVDSIDEANVAAAHTKKPILILGYTLRDRLQEAVRRGYGLTTYASETIEVLSKIATTRHPAKLHLKIETGTSRQGILPTDLPQFIRRILKNKHLRIEGVSTHFANSEEAHDPSYAMEQLQRFETAVAELALLGVHPPVMHTACSAAAILHPQTRFTAVRAGIALYGLWPSEETREFAPQNLRLTPALTWKTVIAQVKHLPTGTPISYGRTERLKRDSRIAVLPIGYWDGYDRALSSQGNVLIRGKRAKILGRVCMNMCMADVTDIPSARIEDEVVLLGHQGKERIYAEELAEKAKTINYEIVTRINPLIPRNLLK
jgi:alanine racemase